MVDERPPVKSGDSIRILETISGSTRKRLGTVSVIDLTGHIWFADRNGLGVGLATRWELVDVPAAAVSARPSVPVAAPTGKGEARAAVPNTTTNDHQEVPDGGE
jgi:hypothetical protein